MPLILRLLAAILPALALFSAVALSTSAQAAPVAEPTTRYGTPCPVSGGTVTDGSADASQQLTWNWYCDLRVTNVPVDSTTQVPDLDVQVSKPGTSWASAGCSENRVFIYCSGTANTQEAVIWYTGTEGVYEVWLKIDELAAGDWTEVRIVSGTSVLWQATVQERLATRPTVGVALGGDGTVTEGQTTRIPFTVSGAASTDVRVQIAQSGDCVQGGGATRAIPANGSDQHVQLVDDSVNERSCTVMITILPGGLYQINPNRASVSVHVLDDDAPDPDSLGDQIDEAEADLQFPTSPAAADNENGMYPLESNSGPHASLNACFSAGAQSCFFWQGWAPWPNAYGWYGSK